MSYSSHLKNELTKIIPTEDCCIISEIAGLIGSCATIKIQGFNKIGLEFSGENPAVIRLVFKLLKIQYGYSMDIVAAKNNQLQQKNLYRGLVYDTHVASEVLFDTRIMENGSWSLEPVTTDKLKLMNNPCCRYSYLRGFFLGSGFMLNPKKNYQLEFIAGHQDQAEYISNLLKVDGIPASYYLRGNIHVLTIKDSEGISDLLSGMGALKAMLELENIRILKSMKNNVNRIVNCETANMSKTINRSMIQIDIINKIRKTPLWNNLEEDLVKLALLRIKYPTDSLQELGDRMSPPISKSAVNYRFNKLMKIGKEL
ncbi:MAG: DNA-binding protein WhiA [Tissierellia bacterium]|nr:DNA-binding protein WhiA [Tissierellia bacterium]